MGLKDALFRESSFFRDELTYLKGIGPKTGQMLAREVGLHSYADLLCYFPYRYVDRRYFTPIGKLTEYSDIVQIKGRILQFETQGGGDKKRLIAVFTDGTGSLRLIWFQGIEFVLKQYTTGKDYIILGKPHLFNDSLYLNHPQLEPADHPNTLTGGLMPVYSSTEKLTKVRMDSKGIARLSKQIITRWEKERIDLKENLPASVIENNKLPGRAQALMWMHYPPDEQAQEQAVTRLKIEETLAQQLHFSRARAMNRAAFEGMVFKSVPTLNTFYKEHMPFDLTGAQKRVIKEIYADMGSGKQMNRLLQGDVGSGKTMVAFICMLIAADGKAQSALMAPTEILAEQHYQSLKPMADKVGLGIALLTGSTKAKERQIIFSGLAEGSISILIGTHALIEDPVQFQRLGLVVIDEQHRFGVEQRAKLWAKNPRQLPHVLVMTATPIPRTLAMTVYGDLDTSRIDELPPGRKPVKTQVYRESLRPKMYELVRTELAAGRQVYFVFPLIEESAATDMKDLEKGFLEITEALKGYTAARLHGRMKPAEKEKVMRAFAAKEIQVLVATTVIEVGVNVPNASVMVIENAERFGLSQLHQLRGRVGRGADAAYCILMCSSKVSAMAREKLQIMEKTQDGFVIAEKDLELRGPGVISGHQQSGKWELNFTHLGEDAALIENMRNTADALVGPDPKLEAPEMAVVRRLLEMYRPVADKPERVG